MTRTIRIATILLFASTGSTALTAHADSMEAMCEFYKEGDHKSNRSSPCTFSQRQGYIDIDLRNGKNYSLKPTKHEDHYKDQKGDKVVRTREHGTRHVYKWDHKKIVVTFTEHEAGSSYQRERDSSDHFGKTPHRLEDLIGTRASQAEEVMETRGYKYRNGSKSAGSGYSNWTERDTGRCVTVHAEHGHIKSAIYSTDYDCDA